MVVFPIFICFFFIKKNVFFFIKKKHILEFFRSLVNDIDCKIKKTKAEFDFQIPKNQRPKEITEKLEKNLAKITKLSLKVEKLEEEAKIDEAQNLDAEIQALKKKTEELLSMEKTDKEGLGQKEFQVFKFGILIIIIYLGL